MQYLSINNSPEFNVQLLAEDQVLYTQNYFNQFSINPFKVIEDCQKYKNFSLISAVATVALGIILIGFVNLTAGIIVTSLAFVSISAWLIFRNKQISTQLESNTEIGTLKAIYQKMIDSIKTRHEILEEIFKININKANFAEDKENLEKFFTTCMEAVAPFLENEEYEKFFNNSMNPSTSNPFIIEIIEANPPFMPLLLAHAHMLQENKSNFKVRMDDLEKWAVMIANASISNSMVGKKWQKLQEACRNYSQSYNSYLKTENDEKDNIVYNDSESIM